MKGIQSIKGKGSVWPQGWDIGFELTGSGWNAWDQRGRIWALGNIKKN